MNLPRYLFIIFLFCTFTACDKSTDEHTYTLYTTNFPKNTGRVGVATFDLSKGMLAESICQEAADMYAEDFTKRKKLNKWDETTNVRYWCEKGRFKE